jgi:hypothetical protein
LSFRNNIERLWNLLKHLFQFRLIFVLFLISKYYSSLFVISIYFSASQSKRKMEVLSPDQRINMSLEDVIKSTNEKNKQKRESKKPQNKPPGKKPSGGITVSKPASGAGRRRVNTNKMATNTRRPNSANSAKTNNTQNSAKVAKSVGTGKANRNANIAMKRGLNTTGKATKMEINSEVNKQKQKRGPGGGGLKITFKPGELNKTTDRTVSQQIKAVLSRQSPRNAGRPSTARSTNSNNSAGSNNNPGRPRGRVNITKVKR